MSDDHHIFRKGILSIASEDENIEILGEASNGEEALKLIEEKQPDKILCLPTLWPGHSTHHLFFPGTLSVKQMPYIHLVIELCRSIVNFGAKKVINRSGFLRQGRDRPHRFDLVF